LDAVSVIATEEQKARCFKDAREISCTKRIKVDRGLKRESGQRRHRERQVLGHSVEVQAVSGCTCNQIAADHAARHRGVASVGGGV
jgi:hypothetical protein